MLYLFINFVAYSNPLHTSTLVGNVNFDPLNLASKDFTYKRFLYDRTPCEILYDYRDAELKHSRLAMLSAVAYPVQEQLNPILANMFNTPNELANSNLSPSLINGNLNPSILLFFMGLASGLELYKINNQKYSRIPGDYNWRFTSAVYGTDAFEKLQAGEIWNGRIAMIATLEYVIQEAITQKPVIFF